MAATGDVKARLVIPDEVDVVAVVGSANDTMHREGICRQDGWMEEPNGHPDERGYSYFLSIYKAT